MAGLRGLLIEDNPVDRAFARFVVGHAKRLGFALDEAADAEEAMDLLSKNEYDIVVSDHHLAGPVTGIDILHRVGKAQPNCKRMLLTADERWEITEEAFWKDAAERVVRKSSGAQEILENVKELLEGD